MDLEGKFRAFGFDTVTVKGYDVEAIWNAIEDVSIIAVGLEVRHALEATKILTDNGISAHVVDMLTVCQRRSEIVRKHRLNFAGIRR